MLAFYRSLFHLYPTAYRCEYGDEMMEVLSEVQALTRNRSPLSRILSGGHEAGGLLYGAMREHFRSIISPYDGKMLSSMFSSMFLSRRFTMRSDFRFPKATVALMTIILAAVILAIEKAKAISASVPHANLPVGPIQPAQITIVPTLLVVLISAIVAGVFGWGILFALRRSGVHHLAEMNPSADARTGK
jgi:hypothetical protein